MLGQNCEGIKRTLCSAFMCMTHKQAEHNDITLFSEDLITRLNFRRFTEAKEFEFPVSQISKELIEEYEKYLIKSMLEGLVADTFWIREKSGILVRKKKERIVRIKCNGTEGKATLEVMSPTDLSTITFHQELDCQKCLLMSNRSLRSGKLALVPSVAFDKHMSRGLVLEHHDHHALQEWEGRLRRHLRVVSYPVRIITKQNGRKSATLHISPSRLYLSRGFPPKFHMLGSWDIALHANNLVLLNRSIQLNVNYDGTDRLTLGTDNARDIFDTIYGCYGKLTPKNDANVDMDMIVPSSRRRLASMPTSVRNEMSLRSVSGRSTTLSYS